MPSNAPEPAETPVAIGLGLGSNIGDKPANLAAGLAHLEARGAVKIGAVSSIYRTAPWGYLDQEDFANACALATTTLSPRALLAEVKAVEAEMGRLQGLRWGPRLIDIDILFYGDHEIEWPELVLPHKELFRRAFVLEPLAEIAPQLMLGGRSVKEAAAEADGTGVERWFKS
ncbi:2-amino-4-hydroxy-6-hydroxymethyldihydropteridine diphosphokinase [Methylocella silvestris]|uniref:2-amino-4-hydroxy-6-hydroxymethyldihydropteridine pyrophosphokinase n=1 Tax=Methylocella silvestris TaxID=199596 RepID=A0A2J7TCV8_METSI|nr:2-amino-4-hydroxy-6-hydroxymethyldihydropteridine diphosphokinase [Methylocella silvestris]PNG24598.1 2-amino-4-hydroxy-6-hydroxymethyldihydropteridine diphosphokinase [Methylocella silvestris]